MKYLAVIIPVFNNVHLTAQAIDSLIKCTKSNLIPIIVNDGSDDCETEPYCVELSRRTKNFFYHRNMRHIERRLLIKSYSERCLFMGFCLFALCIQLLCSVCLIDCA